jgi:hypothetical protein
VSKPSWSSDSRQLHYMLGGCLNYLRWVTLDIQTQVKSIEGKRQAVLKIPRNLGIPTPEPGLVDLFDVSPTGDVYIYLVYRNNQQPVLCLFDNHTHKSSEIGPVEGGFIIQVDWDSAETMAVVEIAHEIGSSLYLVEIPTRTIILVHEPVGEWSLSPDGNRLALIDWQNGILYLYDIESHHLVQTVATGDHPGWSQDGKTIYYSDQNFSWDDGPNRIMRYRVEQDEVSVLFDTPRITSTLLNEVSAPFLVSPDEKKIAVWGQDVIWLYIFE